VQASPGVDAHSDGNEMTNPVTAQVWAEHAIWPQDPGFPRALADGVTTLHILPVGTSRSTPAALSRRSMYQRHP
jgi:imidazolonepropionase-like amidohydrolase